MDLLPDSEQILFKCHICESAYPSKDGLAEHVETHSPDRPYTCNYCNKKFAKKFILTLHIRSHTGEKPYACDSCEKRFPQKSDLTRHQRVHSGEKPFICDICLKMFNQKPALTQHRRIHTGEKPFSCNICLRRFNKKASVIQHCCEAPAKKIEQSVNGESKESIIMIKTKPFTCSLCPKQFSTKFCLLEHEKVHKQGKTYACDICKKEFAYKSSFMKHDLSHLDGKVKGCDVCFKLFASNLALQIHTCIKPDFVTETYVLPDGIPYLSDADIIIEEQSEINEEEPETESPDINENIDPSFEDNKPYVCHFCQKGFKRKYILNLHLRSHTGEKPYDCDECEKRFPQKSDLVRHKRIHTGEKPYACDFCPKRFAQKPGMTQHRRTHTGEKPFSCKTCFKTFNKKASVVEHCCVVPGSKKPLKLKPFACGFESCDKLFSTKFGLTLHRRLHTSGDYTCTICGKGFAYQTTLTKHLLSHTVEGEFYCNDCDQVFTDKASYTSHRRSHRSVLKCQKCLQVFTGKQGLDDHWCKTPEECLVCHLCQELFRSVYDFKRHLLQKHSKRAVVCIKCHAVIENSVGNTCNACKNPTVSKADSDQSSEDSDFDENSSHPGKENSDDILNLMESVSKNSNFQILARESVMYYEEQSRLVTHPDSSNLEANGNESSENFDLSHKTYLDSPNLQVLAGACVQFSGNGNELSPKQKTVQILAGASALRSGTHLLYDYNPSSS